MGGLKIYAVLVVVALFNLCGCSIIDGCIDEENCDQESEGCTGSVRFLDKDDKELKVVSSKDSPDIRLGLKTRGGKAIMEGNCCFEARKKKEGEGGESIPLTDNKEYSLSFKVNYVIPSPCVPGASTSWLPIVITLVVIAVVAVVAVVVYMKKRSSGHSPVSTQA